MMHTIWVIGRSTNIGKTTITVALVREMGRRGISCTAFKPFGVVRLWDRLDFIMREMPHGQLHGPDAARLAACSPLTADGSADIVAPCYFLSFHEIHEVMLLRTGAEVLGNHRLQRIRTAQHLLDRHDVRTVLEQKGLAAKLSGDLDSLRVSQATTLYDTVVAQSFATLRQLPAETIICEGAGGFLPVWPSQELPQAIVIVLASRVLLATEITHSLRAQTRTGNSPRLTNPDRFCRTYARKLRSFSYPLTVSDRIPEVADAMARTLVDSCNESTP